jgi:hypothetical protein
MAEEMSKEDIESKIIDGTYDLVPEEKRHSKVWDTFSRIVDENQKLITDFAACSKCKKVYVCNHGSGTSNLLKHSCEKAAKRPTRYLSFLKFQICTCHCTCIVFRTRRVEKGLIPPTEQIKTAIIEAAVIFVACDIRPYNIVTGKGFVKFAQKLINIGAEFRKVDATAAVPHATTVARNAEDKAEKLRVSVAKKVRNAVSVVGGSVTFDLWTDDYKKISYLGMTLHYTDDNFRLYERILCVAEFDGELKKTGDNIRKLVLDCLKRFQIHDCIDKLVFVTDRGSNVLAALRNTNHLFCSAHILNNVLEHSTKPKNQGEDDTVTSLIDACRTLVTYFKRSSLQSRLKKTLKSKFAFY